VVWQEEGMGEEEGEEEEEKGAGVVAAAMAAGTLVLLSRASWPRRTWRRCAVIFCSPAES